MASNIFTIAEFCVICMMNTSLFNTLHKEGWISDETFDKIKTHPKEKQRSVYTEIKTMLYLGILLLTTGLGIVVYKNIDSIGHQAVLLFIALLSAGSFYYCFSKKPAFTTGKALSPDAFFDYILLLACLCFIIFIGYWQYAYHVFGERFGLVIFIPMIVLFFCAYFFDHLGVLSLAITNLAAWVGIAVTPAAILKANDFNSATIIYTGLLLGIALIVAGKLSVGRKIKMHFEFTYTNFGMHVLFISCLAGLFHFDSLNVLWFAGLCGIVIYFYREALRTRSFYFCLFLALYAYTGLSYMVIFSIEHYRIFSIRDMGAFYIACIYFIGSGIGLIFFLINMNKKINTR
jgi:hypothetical protein